SGGRRRRRRTRGRGNGGCAWRRFLVSACVVADGWTAGSGGGRDRQGREQRPQGGGAGGAGRAPVGQLRELVERPADLTAPQRRPVGRGHVASAEAGDAVEVAGV